MIAAMTKKRPSGEQKKRPRRQKFDAKRLAEIASMLDLYLGRIKTMRASMQAGRIPYIEFDGASGIERVEKELEVWCRLATFDLLNRRGQTPDLN